MRGSPPSPRSPVLNGQTDDPVAQRLHAEGLIPLEEAGAVLPPVEGRTISPRTLWRWIVYGKRKVRLEAVQLVGDRWFTSRPALARFSAALTARRPRPGRGRTGRRR